MIVVMVMVVMLMVVMVMVVGDGGDGGCDDDGGGDGGGNNFALGKADLKRDKGSIKVIQNLKGKVTDFPGGAVDKNPPAIQGTWRFKPFSRKIPHASEQLSPCTTTTEAHEPRACALQ